MNHKYRISTLLGAGLLGFVFLTLPASSQDNESISVKEIMDSMITPNTNALWGAYEVTTDEQWLALEAAANAVLAAADMLTTGGSNAQDQAKAINEDWQQFNRDMMAAGRAALAAIKARDEEALFNAGNDLLYPPCESCHSRYMAQ
ncbi:MAG: hypothetical protein RLZZ385_2077 [Pseudomonadota bacterium]|jgi:hypothetical protein